MKPLVSVLMSVHKEKDLFFKKSLDSLISQSLKNWELILVDDGMTESNKTLLRSYRDSRIQVITNEKNLGLTQSLNRAASYSQGQLLARLDSDDYCRSERLIRQVVFLEGNQDVVLCGTRYNEMINGRETVPRVPLPIGHRNILEAIPRFNPFAHSTLMVRSKSFREVGGYDDSYRYAQDYDLIYRLSKIGKLANIDQTLVVRNISIYNISFNKFKAQLFCALRVRFRASLNGGFKPKNILPLLRSTLILTLPQKFIYFLKKMRED